MTEENTPFRHRAPLWGSTWVTLCSAQLVIMIGSSFLGHADVSSGMRNTRTTVSNVWLCGKWIEKQIEQHLIPGQTPFPPHPGKHKVTKGWSKDTGKAGLDGQTASQRGGKCFKIYRREEQKLKSRGNRGVSKLDCLEMLPQRGGQHLLVFPSLETQEREGQKERGKNP